jgi:hypothetical protein
MNSSISSSNDATDASDSRFMLTVLLSAVMVIATGLVLRRLPLEKEDGSASQRYWALKTHTFDAAFDIVFVGDSRTYRGISPVDVQKGLPGVRVGNAGYSSSGFSGILLDHAERCLLKGSPSKSIVLGVTPHSLTPGAAKNSHYLQEKGRPGSEVLELIYLSRLKAFFARHSLEALGRCLLRPQSERQHGPQHGYFEHFYDDGWAATDSIPCDSESALASYQHIFDNNQVSPAVCDALFDRVRRWKASGIRVFAFRPPTTAKMVALEHELSGFDETGFVKRFTEAGGVWLEVENNYESYDGSHLRMDSARELSARLGRQIAAKLAHSVE